MARPRLTAALNWTRYESAVLAVFIEALRELGCYERLPETEEPLNLELFWVAERVHQGRLLSGAGTIPFGLVFDSRNQPQPDDVSGDDRLRKRPDFYCLMRNSQAADYRRAQMRYYLEGKRLGEKKDGREFNDLYSEEGVARFTSATHGYAKGCRSACMIGYMQNMEPKTILNEVNSFATKRLVPSLSLAATTWVERHANLLRQDPLTREFDSTALQLHHLWADLRHCRFDYPTDLPPQAATPPKKPRKKPQPQNKPK